MLNIPELVSAAAHAEPVSHATVTGTEIEFEQCDSVGKVSKVTIEPCQGGNGTLESPCEFHYGSNYTITLDFTSTVSSERPRNNLIAYDSTESLGAGYDHYPYSGQSFDACTYTTCPVPQDTPATYTYKFRTLKSYFDSLKFNVTDTLQGPAFICAGFPIKFVE
ncbi:hypothetical protein DB88DRAFT_441538 [Papiliotrema laurentii]|uniref:Phosphatidylglycerol/phosphatidylinositol transfer protein n=1 Tax=Papiliotrema laurentii TaxID=5418 RepID=A0AAD9CXN3_PAPLA|nr:hypothetical protein DB88DRAFT_441538 [Papiliotrema laurentii]